MSETGSKKYIIYILEKKNKMLKNDPNFPLLPIS